MNHLLDLQRRRHTPHVPAIVLVFLVFLAACGPSLSAQSTNATDAKRYTLTGRIVSIDRPAQSITVDGDEIPGFMAAMTMPYQVKDAGVLEKLSHGDQIKAEIVLENDGAYLEDVVVVRKAPPQKPAK
jgi:protein SCO1